MIYGAPSNLHRTAGVFPGLSTELLNTLCAWRAALLKRTTSMARLRFLTRRLGDWRSCQLRKNTGLLGVGSYSALSRVLAISSDLLRAKEVRHAAKLLCVRNVECMRHDC